LEAQSSLENTFPQTRVQQFTDGDVYIGLDAYSLPQKKIQVLQDSLRILSGLYGLLKPLDLIQAYRLEMGTKLPIGESRNLYEYGNLQLLKL
jgi:cytoplasmic iron level regulating protein YaaA (DUF328/UPF0246 family)